MADSSNYYIFNGEPVHIDSLPAEIQQVIEPIRYSQDKKEGQHYATVVWIFFFIIGYIAIRRALKEKGTVVLKGYVSGRTGHRTNEGTTPDLLSEYHVYHGKDLVFPPEQYDKILSRRFPYYRRLSPSLKDKFLFRVKKTLQSKTFLIKSKEPFVEMPMLISATAVQLTFGLEKYLLPHYPYIRIYSEEYFSKGTLKVLAGHVYGNTITLAWNHFLKGHENYEDGENVGLHEMAHALYFQMVEAETGYCRDFTVSFNSILKAGTNVHQEKNAHSSNLFRPNAFRNLQEFWAESVELFFERPQELQSGYPDVYEILKGLLKQDPANKLFPVAG